MRVEPTVKSVVLLSIPVVLNGLMYLFLTSGSWVGPSFDHNVQLEPALVLLGGVIVWTAVPYVAAMTSRSPKRAERVCCVSGCLCLAANYAFGPTWEYLFLFRYPALE